MRTHTGETPYPCHLCGYQAKSCHTLTAHTGPVFSFWRPKQDLSKNKQAILAP